MPKLGGSRMPSVPPAASEPAARAAHRGKHRAARNICLQQASRQPGDEPGEAAVDTVAQAAHAQNFGHQHEKRDAGEDKAVHAAPAHQPEAVESGQPALHQQIEHRRHCNGERHRHSARQQ